MYCRCGSSKELVKRQEKQEWQEKGETVEYLHCPACTRNYLTEKERKKLNR